jgi:two-component system response regulator GlrR
VARILVVDDDPTVLESCVETLEEAGYRPEGYTRGQAALDALVNARADLLVVDWKMPGLDGLEVVRRARVLQPDVKAVMITADLPAIAGRALAAGVLQVINKPFTVQELVDAVRAIVGNPTPDA